MKYLIFLFSFMIISCSPFVYPIEIEVKKEASWALNESSVEKLAIFALYNTKDTTLPQELANGMAEEIEKNIGGIIPVYVMNSNEINSAITADLSYIGGLTESKTLLIVDSLEIGEYNVETFGQNMYSNSTSSTTLIYLPFSYKFSVFDIDSLTFRHNIRYSDSLLWQVYSDENISDVRMVSQADLTLKENFKKVGNLSMAKFFPTWKTETRNLVVYSKDKWIEALNYAENFDWQPAIKIWMTELDNDNNLIKAHAAYNIAVACELSGDFELALEWLDFSLSKYYSSDADLMKKRLKITK